MSQTSVSKEKSTSDRLKSIGSFLLGAVAAPFLVTGLLRPLEWIFSLDTLADFFWAVIAFPILVLGAVSIALWRRGHKAFAVGLGTGTIVHYVFLAWLVSGLPGENFDEGG